MKRPEEVTLSREDGEALITRLEADALTAKDRRGWIAKANSYCVSWIRGRP